MIDTIPIEVPDFGGLDEPLPPIPVSGCQQRLTALVARMKEAHMDILLVYAERDHFANLAFLTAFDPRFEEALLLPDATGPRWVLVENECMGFLPDARLNCETVLFQNFSLLGQPRGDSRSPRAIFADFGIAQGDSVGCAGWMYFEGLLDDNPGNAIEIPAYIVDLLRSPVGAPWENPQRPRALHKSRRRPACDQFRESDRQFEFAPIRISESVLFVVPSVREGAAENELEKQLTCLGFPLSCHAMISFG